jgi:hypothetical protein
LEGEFAFDYDHVLFAQPARRLARDSRLRAKIRSRRASRPSRLAASVISPTSRDNRVALLSFIDFRRNSVFCPLEPFVPDGT